MRRKKVELYIFWKDTPVELVNTSDFRILAWKTSVQPVKLLRYPLKNSQTCCNNFKGEFLWLAKNTTRIKSFNHEECSSSKINTANLKELFSPLNPFWIPRKHIKKKEIHHLPTVQSSPTPNKLLFFYWYSLPIFFVSLYNV